MSFVNAYPFLSEIDEHIRNSIDINELHLPDTEQIKLLNELGGKLGCYLVLYKSGYTCYGKQLCQMIKSAALNAEGLRLLQTYEARFNYQNLIMVAYHRSLTIRTGMSI